MFLKYMRKSKKQTKNKKQQQQQQKVNPLKASCHHIKTGWFSLQINDGNFELCWVNQLQPDVAYLYPLITSEDLKVFWRFKGV